MIFLSNLFPFVKNSFKNKIFHTKLRVMLKATLSLLEELVCLNPVLRSIRGMVVQVSLEEAPKYIEEVQVLF